MCRTDPSLSLDRRQRLATVSRGSVRTPCLAVRSLILSLGNAVSCENRRFDRAVPRPGRADGAALCGRWIAQAIEKTRGRPATKSPAPTCRVRHHARGAASFRYLVNRHKGRYNQPLCWASSSQAVVPNDIALGGVVRKRRWGQPFAGEGGAPSRDVNRDLEAYTAASGMAAHPDSPRCGIDRDVAKLTRPLAPGKRQYRTVGG